MEDLNWKIEDFQAWLMAQEPDAIVGETDRCEKCPIATWRKPLDGPISVSPDTIVFMTTKDELTPPDWVADFVTGIDEYHSKDGEQETTYLHEPATAGECLEVLRQIA